MDNDMPLIELREASKCYKTGTAEIVILKKAELSIRREDTVAIVGASGIGKSTVLHIMGTLEHLDAGRLLFDNRDITDFDTTRLAQFRNRHMGFVFQFHHLLPEFSAIENVMMPALIAGTKSASARSSAKTLLVRVGLSGRLEHRVTQLSGGEQQRVALARALVMKPSVLLADEPTGNLDEKNSEEVHQLLMELNRELGMTLVTVTHNPVLAKRMSRRVTLSEKKIIDA